MNHGKFVFSQLITFCSHNEFKKCVDRYNGNSNVRKFRCWHQFLCLIFGHLTNRESLRDIVNCLNAQGSRLYHLGFPSEVRRSTLSDANQRRDWRIYADFASLLMVRARELYRPGSELARDMHYAVYALDSSLVRLCLSIFSWASYRKTTAGIKMHTLLNVATNLPEFFFLTDGRRHDLKTLPKINFQAGSFYLMDGAYLDLNQLYRAHQQKAWFVVRAKSNMNLKRKFSIPHKDQPNIKKDQCALFVVYGSKRAYPEPIRIIRVKDPETGKSISLLTNNFELRATDITELYRKRWRIELFFKWIKQHLRLKVFWGQNENAVKTQIWTALSTYLILAIIKKRLEIPQNLYEIQQILSVSAFDKVPLDQLLSPKGIQNPKKADHKQLKMF